MNEKENFRHGFIGEYKHFPERCYDVMSHARKASLRMYVVVLIEEKST